MIASVGRLAIFLSILAVALVPRLAQATGTVPQGGYGTFAYTGFTGPANNHQWDILNPSSTIIATSASPGGWSVSFTSPNFTVGAPSTATIANGYTVRFNSNAGPGQISTSTHSAPFNVVSAQVPPNLLSAAGGPAMVGVQWAPYAGLPASSFNLKRGTAHGGPYTTIQTGLTGINAIDSTVSNGTTYYYVVSAITTAGETPNSNELYATPEAAPSKTATQLFTGVGQSLDGPGYAVINSALYPTPVITTGSYVDSNNLTHYWETDLSYFIASGTTASDNGDSGPEASYTDPIAGGGTLGWYPDSSGTGTGLFAHLPWYYDPVETIQVYMNFQGLEVDSNTQVNQLTKAPPGGGGVVAAIWYYRAAEWHLVGGLPAYDGAPSTNYGYAPNCPIDVNLAEILETASAIDSRKVYGQPMITGEIPADPNAPLRNPNFLNWTWNGGLFVGNSPWGSGDDSGTARVQFWPQTTPPTFYDPLFTGLTLIYNGYPKQFPAPGGLVLAFPASNDPNLGVQPGQATWANAWNLSNATIGAALVPPGSSPQYINLNLTGFSPYMILALQNESTIVQNGTGVWCYFGDPSWAAATGLFSQSDATPRQWILDLWPAAPPIPPQP